MKLSFKDKYLYLPILILGIYFIIRLIDQAKLIWTFPLDSTNDWASYMVQLWFLSKCGFHSYCPYWYNGFITFIVTSPGWYFFTSPFYWITKSITSATYFSLLALYLISFVLFYFIGKKEKFSNVKIISFFLFFFANAVAIGNFIRLGRIVSLFGFVVLIGLFLLILIYKDRKINFGFLFLISPLYAIMLLSHFQEAILGSFLLMGLFLVKNNKERFFIIVGIFLAILLSSFWLYPFIIGLDNSLTTDYEGKWLWAFDKDELLTNIAASITPLIFFFVFYYYIKSYNRKEFLFFLPLFFLCILFFLRLTPLIPILRNISPDPFILFFLFLIIFLFFKTDYNLYPHFLIKLIPVGVLILLMLSTLISAFNTPYFKQHEEIDRIISDNLKDIDGNFIMVGFLDYPYPRAYYSYVPIYFNKTTADGYYPYLTTAEYNEGLKKLYNLDDKDFVKNLKLFNVTNVFGYRDSCEKLDKQGLKLKSSKDKVCLYTF